jgi:biopolymer transport protein ExbD
MLGADSDDVAFPALHEEPARPEKPTHGRAASEPPAAPGWAWGEDDSDDDEAGDGFDEEIEIIGEVAVEDTESRSGGRFDVDAPAGPEPDRDPGSRSSHVALPVAASRDWDEDRPDAEADDEDAFTLARGGPVTVEELDLAPMVDVAFQLVLFFMVTATTVLYKTLEVPKPSTEPPPGAVVQGRSRALDDFKNDYILVEIDSGGAMKLDREPIPAEMDTLVERLRTAREKTGRKAMLLSAEYTTPHRITVLAIDAANEIGLGIALARPASPQGPGPGLLRAAPPPRASVQPPPASTRAGS